MGQDSMPVNPSDADQLKKYASDLVKVYQSERQKREELEAANRQLVQYEAELKKTIAELQAVCKELHEAYIDTIHRLVLAAEYKDEDTGYHIVRIGRYSALIAEKIGMPAGDVQKILYAALMHDVGKIGIPDNILMKPGKLSEKEFELMKTHTTIGDKILSDSKAEILQMARQIALSHHEKWNGRGYPQGLSGEEIYLAARIVGLADVFDALTSRRPYKDAFPVEIALDIIRQERGEHFDPGIVDVFFENIDEILKIKEEVGLPGDVSLDGFTLSERDRAGDGT